MYSQIIHVVKIVPVIIPMYTEISVKNILNLFNYPFSTNHETTFRTSVIVETKGNWFIVNFRQIFSLSFYLNVSQSSLSFNEFASMSYMESPLL